MHLHRILIIVLISVFYCACTKIEIDGSLQSACYSYSVRGIQDYITRISIDDNHLSWNADDKIGIFVSDNLQDNRLFSNSGGNLFTGGFKKTGITKASVSYYAYYPYRDDAFVNGTVIQGRLPDKQTAPFHSEADYIVAEPIKNEVYDENSMPSLNFVFSNHLFSVLKITITNTNESLKNERLLGIDVMTDATPLSGNFTVDVTNPEVSFSSSAYSNVVSMDYPSESDSPIIGINENHSLYLVVNNICDDKVKVRVRTSRYVGYVYSSRKITTHAGETTYIEPIDIASLSDVKSVKRLVYWGDSIASSNIIEWLQYLLGDEWRVIGGGIAGATALSIAARQGGIPLLTEKAVTIPASSSAIVNIGRFCTQCTSDNYAPIGTYYLSSKYWYDVNADRYCNPACPLVNEFELCGVKCKIKSGSSNFNISRVENGEPVYAPAFSHITTFAGREYKDADVTVTYMGTNQRNDISDQQLANCYQAMTDYSSSKKHIVVGFHFDIIDGRDFRYWTPEYRDYFRNKFGDNYLDLRTVGAVNAERLCVEIGQHSSASEMSPEDKYYVGLGEWPVSWTGSRRGNIHPTIWGHRAIAIMVYEKMQELGYLDL